MTRPTRRGFSLIVCIVFAVAAATVSVAQDDRAADRAAIKAHIDSIFQAFIKKDVAALRATHAENWLGYLDNSGRMLKGINNYMDWNQLDPKSPYGMKSYKFREFNMIFKGEAAFVCFVADVESNPWPRQSAAPRAANLRFLHQERRQVDSERQLYRSASGDGGRAISVATLSGR